MVWTGQQIAEKNLPLLDGVAPTLQAVLEERFGADVRVEDIKAPTGLKALLEASSSASFNGGGGGLLGLLTGRGGRVQVDVNHNHNLPEIQQYLQEQAVAARYHTFY